MVVPEFRLAATIFVAFLAVMTVACGAASTATPSPTGFAQTSTTFAGSPTATIAPVLQTPGSAPVSTAAPTQTTPKTSPVYIQLADPLDEPEFYCLDVPGAGTAVRLRSALQAHTCKPLNTAEDELFTLDHPSDGQIYMEAYDLCAEATGTTAGSLIFLQRCSDSPNQRFAIEDGLVRLAGAGDSGLCLAVDPGDGIPTGGPSHLRRDLTLEDCETTDPSRSRWITGIFDY